MFSDYMNWTEKQWETYRNAMVTISLEDLDRFVRAIELLQNDARLNSDERDAWKAHLPPLVRLLAEELSSISQMRGE